jgi:tRNA A37 methylthiotransferase MiaB
VDDILAEFHRGVDEGYRIFNVLGDDPGCYGVDLSSSFPRLLDALFDASRLRGGSGQLHATTGNIRFHLSEIHPKHLILYDRELLGLPGLPMLKNILIPIQSGSDRVLQLMEREHSAASLLQTLHRIRRRCPGVRLETQIIVGFPSETDSDLEKTLDFVRSARFDSVVVFPYHDKEGPFASKHDAKIPPEEIQRRMRSAFRYFRRARIRAYDSCP